MTHGLNDIMSTYLKHPSHHSGLSQWPSSQWGGCLAPSPWVSLPIALEGKFKQHSFERYISCANAMNIFIEVSSRLFISVFCISAGGTRCSWLTS